MSDVTISPNDTGRSIRPAPPMRLFVTGGRGVLGRALVPMAQKAGHAVAAPSHDELDLFDPAPSRAQHALGFTRAGRRGVALRLDLLDGPGTGHDEPLPTFGATLHVADAARALLAALTLPPGIYNVCRDGERVSNERISQMAGWRPLH
jgi:nucleoside-diphosphate-sugar epimerase